LQVVLLIRGGYIPYMYVTAMLPFCSLLIGGVADRWWGPVNYYWFRNRAMRPPRLVTLRISSGRLAVVSFSIIFAISAVPSWFHALKTQAKADGVSAEFDATAWVERNLPKGAVVVVDDYMWTDIKMHSQVDPVSIWKVDGDPWITENVLPRGYKSIDYIVLIPQTASTLSRLPTLAIAWKHSLVVKEFGDNLVVRKIVKN
jgi:hypothetical protein